MIKHKSSYVVMHNAGGADNTGYFKDGIVNDVNAFFDECIEMGLKSGLDKESLILDPGFGFGKSGDDNYELLSRLREARRLQTACRCFAQEIYKRRRYRKL